MAEIISTGISSMFDELSEQFQNIQSPYAAFMDSEHEASRQEQDSVEEGMEPVFGEMRKWESLILLGTAATILMLFGLGIRLTKTETARSVAKASAPLAISGAEAIALL